jgi:hypothetical protein
MSTGKPLHQLEGIEAYCGVLTGFNEAFILDRTTKDRLVAEARNCQSLFRKIVQGQDLRPWFLEDEDRFLLLIPSSANVSWPWTNRGDNAESTFAETYPSIYEHLVPHKEQLVSRFDKGVHWWELRACAYYDCFARSKILWPEIAKLPRFSWDDQGTFVNNKGFFLAADEPWLLSVLQSRVQWFCISQLCVPLRLRGGLWQYQCEKQSIDRLRIPETTEPERAALSDRARKATGLARERYQLHQKARHRILADLGHETAALNEKLTTWWTLDFAEFRAELKKAFKTSIPVAERGEWERVLADWKGQHATLTQALVTCEEEINDRVYRLFSMSTSDIRFLEEHARHAMIDYRYGEP